MAKDKVKESADGKSSEESREEKQREKSQEKKAPAKKVSRVRIIRIGGKDIDGSLPLEMAIKNIRGVSFSLANAVTKVSGLGSKKLEELKEDELRKIEEIIENPGKFGIPSWLYNRRADPEEGADRHLISAKLELRHKMDINELKKRKCYRGIRHMSGLPVRGQRTRSSFRKAATVGVSRVKKAPAKGAKSDKK
jgi:small subunit ribosomal protein S13